MTWSGPLVLAAGSMLDQPDRALIDAAADAGFDGIGLRISTGRTMAEIDAVAAHAADRGVVVHDTEVHRIGHEPGDPVRLIEQTAAIGAAALLVVSDLPDRAATMRALTDITACADDAGVRVGLEYMAWTLPSTPLEAIDIAIEAGCELVVDVLHHARVGAGTAELDAIIASRTLGWVQVCDARRAPVQGASASGLVHEARHDRLLPGFGHLALAELVSRLPHDVAVSVEVQSDELSTVPARARAQRLHDAARAVLGPHAPNNTG